MKRKKIFIGSFFLKGFCFFLFFSVFACSKPLFSDDLVASRRFSDLELWHYQGDFTSLVEKEDLSLEEIILAAYRFRQLSDWERFHQGLVYAIPLARKASWKIFLLRELSQDLIEKRDYQAVARILQKEFEIDPALRAYYVEALYWLEEDEHLNRLLPVLLEDPYYSSTQKREFSLYSLVSQIRQDDPRWQESLITFIRDIPASTLHERLRRYFETRPSLWNSLRESQKSALLFKTFLFRENFSQARLHFSSLNENAYWTSFSFWLEGMRAFYGSKSYQEGFDFLSQHRAHFKHSGHVDALEALLLGRQGEKDAFKESYALFAPHQQTLTLSEREQYYELLLWTWRSAEHWDLFVRVAQDSPRELLQARRSDTLFEYMIQDLISLGAWADLKEFFDKQKAILKPRFISRLSYIQARLIDAGLVDSLYPQAARQRDEFLRQARNADPWSYASFMARSFLGETIDDLFIPEEALNDPVLDVKYVLEGAEELENLWRLFFSSGLSEQIYRVWLAYPDYENVFSRRDFIRLISDSLAKDGQWFPSVSVMYRLARLYDEKLTKKDYQRLYPQAFAYSIRHWALENQISYMLLSALVREESLFDHDIVSRAGAQGLAQLRFSTAEEIASDLGMEKFDLDHPDDNLRLGSTYLAKRLEQFNRPFKALLAYNAGFGNARLWEREIDPRLDNDLFLEAVPFRESRDYVRNIFVGTVFYNKLYEEKSRPFNELVRDFFVF